MNPQDSTTKTLSDVISEYLLKLNTETTNTALELAENSPNDDLDIELVKAVKQHPILYDRDHEHCYNKRKKKTSWKTISTALNIDVGTARCRWQELVDIFTEEYVNFYSLGKVPRRKEGEKFKLFNQMLWLVPFIPKILETKTRVMKVETEEPGEKKVIALNKNEIIDEERPIEETKNSESEANEEEKQVETIEIPASPPPVCKEENKSDHFFMMSVIQDLKGLPTNLKFKFKRDVFELLDKYFSMDK